jgi:hypothetical protein
MALESKNVVSICGWCPQLHILEFARTDEDLVLIQQIGGKTVITRNGTLMTLSHGICAPCAEKAKHS